MNSKRFSTFLTIVKISLKFSAKRRLYDHLKTVYSVKLFKLCLHEIQHFFFSNGIVTIWFWKDTALYCHHSCISLNNYNFPFAFLYWSFTIFIFSSVIILLMPNIITCKVCKKKHVFNAKKFDLFFLNL